MSDDPKSEPPAATTKVVGPEKTPRERSLELDDTAPDPTPSGAEATPEPIAAKRASSPDAAVIPAKRAPGPRRSRLAIRAKRISR